MKEKLGQHISGYGKPFQRWNGGSWGRGGPGPSPVGQGEARVRAKAGPSPWFPHITPHFFCGGWGQNEDSPLGAAQVT